MALPGGLLAMCLVFAVLAWRWHSLFASGGGLFLALGIAHAVGTTVATVMTPGFERTFRAVSYASVRSFLYALVLLITTLATYAAVAYTIPHLLASVVGLVISTLVAHAVSAITIGRRNPLWTRTAGPLWLAMVILMTAYLFTIARASS